MSLLEVDIIYYVVFHVLGDVCCRMERVFGRRAMANLCVTNAMREDLAHYWNIQLVLLLFTLHTASLA